MPFSLGYLLSLALDCRLPLLLNKVNIYGEPPRSARADPGVEEFRKVSSSRLTCGPYRRNADECSGGPRALHDAQRAFSSEELPLDSDEITLSGSSSLSCSNCSCLVPSVATQGIVWYQIAPGRHQQGQTSLITERQ